MFKNVYLMMLMNRCKPSTKPPSGKKPRRSAPIVRSGDKKILVRRRSESKDDCGNKLYMVEYSEDGGKTWKVSLFTAQDALEDFLDRHTHTGPAVINATKNKREEDWQNENKER